MAKLTYLEAIRKALWEEMEADERVFLLGEDIAAYGGAFKLTEGFLDRFGPDRVIDTPITEAAIAGAAVGASLMGMRPVAEMQYIDFIACAFNQITNCAAKTRYRWGASVPIVIRGPAGGGLGAGPFHSQNVESFFLNTPGLKIVLPATARDARNLLRGAIRDQDPVLFLEHKALYRTIKEEVPEDDDPEPLGNAAVRRAGSDLSIVTYGAMVHLALRAAETLAEGGADVEVLDLRTLQPLDEIALQETARKTGKVVVLHEATRTGGPGGELAARIVETSFDYLDGPVVRVAAQDTPVPYAKVLEKSFLPSEETLLAAARELLNY